MHAAGRMGAIKQHSFFLIACRARREQITMCSRARKRGPLQSEGDMDRYGSVSGPGRVCWAAGPPVATTVGKPVAWGDRRTLATASRGLPVYVVSVNVTTPCCRQLIQVAGLPNAVDGTARQFARHRIMYAEGLRTLPDHRQQHVQAATDTSLPRCALYDGSVFREVSRPGSQWLDGPIPTQLDGTGTGPPDGLSTARRAARSTCQIKLRQVEDTQDMAINSPRGFALGFAKLPKRAQHCQLTSLDEDAGRRDSSGLVACDQSLWRAVLLRLASSSLGPTLQAAGSSGQPPDRA